MSGRLSMCSEGGRPCDPEASAILSIFLHPTLLVVVTDERDLLYGNVGLVLRDPIFG